MSLSIVSAALIIGACETKETAIFDSGVAEAGVDDTGTDAAVAFTHKCEEYCTLAHERDPACDFSSCGKHCFQSQTNASEHDCIEERNRVLDCAQAPTTTLKCQTPGYVSAEQCQTEAEAYAQCMTQHDGQACVPDATDLNPTPCTQCARKHCCEVYNAFIDHPQAGTYYSCFKNAGCAEGDASDTCDAQCRKNSPIGAQIFDAFASCLQTSCREICN